MLFQKKTFKNMPQQALYNTHSLQVFTPVFLLPEDYSTRIQEFLLFLQKLNVDAAASLPHGDYLWISHTWTDKEIQRKGTFKNKYILCPRWNLFHLGSKVLSCENSLHLWVLASIGSGRVIQSWVKVRTTTMKFEFRYESSKSKFTLIFFVSSLWSLPNFRV